MTPDFVELPRARAIAGVVVRTSNAQERDPGRAALPSLWARFAEADWASRAGDRTAVHGVYTEYASDVDGAYTVVVGREVDGTTAAPLVERTVRVPAGRYAVFTSTGEMPAAVLAGWAGVWAYFARDDAPARAYATDFEYHDPAEPTTVRIYVGVR